MTVTQLIAELTELGPEYKDFLVTFELDDDPDYDVTSFFVRGVAVNATEVILGS